MYINDCTISKLTPAVIEAIKEGSIELDTEFLYDNEEAVNELIDAGINVVMDSNCGDWVGLE